MEALALACGRRHVEFVRLMSDDRVAECVAALSEAESSGPVLREFGFRFPGVDDVAAKMDELRVVISMGQCVDALVGRVPWLPCFDEALTRYRVRTLCRGNEEEAEKVLRWTESDVEAFASEIFEAIRFIRHPYQVEDAFVKMQRVIDSRFNFPNVFDLQVLFYKLGSSAQWAGLGDLTGLEPRPLDAIRQVVLALLGRAPWTRSLAAIVF